MAVTVQVDAGGVTLGLNKLALLFVQKKDLMEAIGMSQLRSIYKTFADEGSPAHSWMPLSPRTIRRNPRKYGAGHKLLIDSGRLRNSIGVKATQNSVVIGTNLVYAAVHQYGSRDFGFGARTAEQESALTKGHASYSYLRLDRVHYGKSGGHRRRIAGPRNAKRVTVPGQLFGYHQNIPPRPYLVFRPEDPERLRKMVETYVRNSAGELGLGGEA